MYLYKVNKVLSLQTLKFPRFPGRVVVKRAILPLLKIKLAFYNTHDEVLSMKCICINARRVLQYPEQAILAKKDDIIYPSQVLIINNCIYTC